MKKYFILIILLVLLPIINVSALSCYETKLDKPLELVGNNATNNFSCTGIESDTLTFKQNETDYSKYFKYEINEDGSGKIDIVDTSMTFSSDIEVGIIIISDGKNNQTLFVKNTAYVKPSTTTTTTTTKNENIKTYTVTLVQKDGSKKTTKTCDVNDIKDTCNVTLPNLDKENFNGWGKSPQCKDGNIGSIKVNEDITYYACYKTNENISTQNSTIYLKKLNIVANDENIDYGTFSMKKTEYKFKVLNDVKNLEINTEVDEGILVNVEGNENLVDGENKVVITLTDPNNNTNKYTLMVTRLKAGETLDNNHYLKGLVIGNYQVDFKKETLVYNLTIDKDINKLQINAVPEESDAKVEIKDNDNLVNGSSVKIIVTGSDKKATTYTINITKESSNNLLLFGAIGIIGLLIILLIVLIIIKTKKNNNNNNNGNAIPQKPANEPVIETLDF